MPPVSLTSTSPNRSGVWSSQSPRSTSATRDRNAQTATALPDWSDRRATKRERPCPSIRAIGTHHATARLPNLNWRTGSTR